MPQGVGTVITMAVVLFVMGIAVFMLQHIYGLNGIKSKTVGDGQYGTARWATPKEIGKTYQCIPFTAEKWRTQAAKGETPTLGNTGQPVPQGIVVGRRGTARHTSALVDTGDVHALMLAGSGGGKTTFWLYPCLELACASGMSFLTTDTKGTVLRGYGSVARQYGYRVSVIDLRNPTHSNGNNLLHLVNKYMDLWKENPGDIAAKAKAEKYAKIIAKTIIRSGMGDSGYGSNAYFYDAAEGLITATILIIAEFAEPEQRHIVSVFKLIQELLAPVSGHGSQGGNQFQELIKLLPEEHKARWFAGAALNSAQESMASVLSTALSRLNAFLDSELEQLLCFDTEIDAETFCREKSAIFVIMPEEDPAKFFMVSLIIQSLYREILAVADEHGGQLPRRCVFYCDEFGTIPKIEDAEMMLSAARSRRLQIVPIVQSFAQLERNYGREGCDIIVDNTQITICGGFTPRSTSAEVISKALGTRTVMSGSVSHGNGRVQSSESLQMISRPLMTAEELKSMPQGTFVVMRTGSHPMKVRLARYPEWGIRLDDTKPYQVTGQGVREVRYANRVEIEMGILERYHPVFAAGEPMPVENEHKKGGLRT